LSYETIYQIIIKERRAGGQWYRLLPMGGRKRRRDRTGKKRDRLKIQPEQELSARLERINQRMEFGHWEVDLVIGARQEGVLLVAVLGAAGFCTGIIMPSRDMMVRAARDNQRTLPYAKLVNAILRRISREKDEILAEVTPFLDLPDWLSQRWVRHYGAETAELIAAACRQEASIDLTVKADPAHWATELSAHLLPNGSLRLADRSPISTLMGYAEGAWWVQDMAASLPARLLDAKAGVTP
jgi:hypothetical protein